jgi:hypothetical protein
MTTKVNNTVSHKTSQGDVLVTKGKLVFIASKELPMCELLNMPGYGWIKPIIISETEKIEVGDKYLYDELGKFQILTCTGQYKSDDTGLVFSNNAKKILALPEHFSPKHLQAIVDGKLKDGDEVYVECNGTVTVAREHLLTNSKEWKEALANPKDCYIHLNSSNHITLHKVEHNIEDRARQAALEDIPNLHEEHYGHVEENRNRAKIRTTYIRAYIRGYKDNLK